MILKLLAFLSFLTEQVAPPRDVNMDADVLLQYMYLLLLRDGYRLYSLINT
jgi:hypothetical protein